TDVWSFGRFNGTETTVVCVVNVPHFEAGTFSGKSAGAECTETTFMCYFGQGVCLIHELAQLIGTEERIDNRRKGFGIDQVNRGKHLVIPNVHTFTDGSGHTGKTYAKLVIQLFPDGTYTTVRQVV